MEWVRRKNFSQLSKRQQYNRIKRLKTGFGMIRKNICKNVVQQEKLKNTSINEKDKNSTIEQDSMLDNPKSVNILAEMSSDEHNEIHILLEKVKYHKDENLINAIVEDTNIDSLTNFRNALQQCCLDMNINHVQTTALLRILRTHQCFQQLPKDSRTLLKTGQSKINLLSMEEGVYWHIGFVRILKKHLLLYDELPSILELELSTDGLSLSRSDPNQYWPIQYRVLNITDFKPLIAGIFKGSQKPSDPNIFFQAFMEEVREVERLGGILINDRRIPFSFKRFVGDAPARAFILNHKSHNSSRPCSKCKVTGFRYENRVMVYLGINHNKRSDKEYAALLDEDHHKGATFLSEISISPVSGVPFEIMHLVYLGVTLRLLNAWFLGKFGFGAKLQSSLLEELSNRYLTLLHWCPKEFARRPRSLSKFSKFKATELRHFLLYASGIITFGILEEKYYFHLLLLYVSMRILTSAKLSEENINIAESALNTFVVYAQDLYTPSFVSYNVHCLQHITDDAREFGPLENCSAFIYENNMPLFKKNIRNHPKPLQQFANRLLEKNDIQHRQKKKIDDNEFVSSIHKSGPMPTITDNTSYKQYKKYESSKFTFIIDGCNNYCKLEDNSLCKIENILKWNSKIFFFVRKFKKNEDLFINPIKSSLIGVYKCKNLSTTLNLITTNCISAKCYCMPSWKESFVLDQTNVNDNEYVVSTLLHSN